MKPSKGSAQVSFGPCPPSLCPGRGERMGGSLGELRLLTLLLPVSCGMRFQLHRVQLESGVHGSFVSPLHLRSFLPSLHNLPAPLGYKPDKTRDNQRSPCWAMRFQGKTDSVVARKMLRIKYKILLEITAPKRLRLEGLLGFF